MCRKLKWLPAIEEQGVEMSGTHIGLGARRQNCRETNSEKGLIWVEAAFLLPLMFLIVAGTAELGNFYVQRGSISNAAHSIALAIQQRPEISAQELYDFQKSVGGGLIPLQEVKADGTPYTDAQPCSVEHCSLKGFGVHIQAAATPISKSSVRTVSRNDWSNPRVKKLQDLHPDWPNRPSPFKEDPNQDRRDDGEPYYVGVQVEWTYRPLFRAVGLRELTSTHFGSVLVEPRESTTAIQQICDALDLPYLPPLEPTDQGRCGMALRASEIQAPVEYVDGVTPLKNRQAVLSCLRRGGRGQTVETVCNARFSEHRVNRNLNGDAQDIPQLMWVSGSYGKQRTPTKSCVFSGGQWRVGKLVVPVGVEPIYQNGAFGQQSDSSAVYLSRDHGLRDCDSVKVANYFAELAWLKETASNLEPTQSGLSSTVSYFTKWWNTTTDSSGGLVRNHLKADAIASAEKNLDIVACYQGLDATTNIPTNRVPCSNQELGLAKLSGLADAYWKQPAGTLGSLSHQVARYLPNGYCVYNNAYNAWWRKNGAGEWRRCKGGVDIKVNSSSDAATSPAG